MLIALVMNEIKGRIKEQVCIFEYLHNNPCSACPALPAEDHRAAQAGCRTIRPLAYAQSWLDLGIKTRMSQRLVLVQYQPDVIDSLPVQLRPDKVPISP